MKILFILVGWFCMAAYMLAEVDNLPLPAKTTIPTNNQSTSNPQDEMPGHVLLAGLSFRLYATRDITLPPLAKTSGAGIIATKTEDHDMWRYFFTGTLVLAGNTKSETPVVLFYNPFVDGALFTRWRWLNQTTLEPIDGIFLLGAALRGEAQTTTLPEWWNQPSGPTTMVLQYNQVRRRFEANFPFDGGDTPVIPFKTSFAKNILVRAQTASAEMTRLTQAIKERVTRLKEGKGLSNHPELQAQKPVILAGIFPYLRTNQHLLLINPIGPKVIFSLDIPQERVNIINLD